MIAPSSMANTIADNVRSALQEDIGSGDLTAQLIDATSLASATIISRQLAVICGRDWVNEVFRQIDSRVKLDWQISDGDSVNTDQCICVLSGPARALLTGERTALNFLQTLSATATRARQYAEAVKGTQVVILDTRKTIPGLRQAQKYAVRCGGCSNHRIGLYDGILIKENHIEAAGSLEKAITQVTQQSPHVLVEVEVESLQQIPRAIAAGAKRLLLDNMSIDQLQEAVRLTAGNASLEASGGVTLENIRQIAETGVDYISVGDITKHIDAIDLSMRFRPQ